MQQLYLADPATLRGTVADAPATVDLRFRYNQDFDSVNSLVPSTIALLRRSSRPS